MASYGQIYRKQKNIMLKNKINFKKIGFIGLIPLFALLIFFKAWAAPQESLLKKMQPYVVSIKNRSVIAAHGEATTSAGTGFIVDVKNGIIATNSHVASPDKVVTEYLVTMHDGREVEGKLLYFDPWLDFAFIKIPHESLYLKENVSFDRDTVNTSTPVCIIGKNENKHFSMQTGTIANPYEISGALTQQAFRISLNAQGGASGSPVIDVESGKVIGIIFASNQLTSAFALPINFVLDALDLVVKGGTPDRFHVGEMLEYVSLDDLEKFYNFPKKEGAEYRKKFPDSFNRALMVGSVLVDSPAAQKDGLEVGDVLIAVNDQEIGPNLYKKEKIVNTSGKKGEEVTLKIIRSGEIKTLKLKPFDLQKRKLSKILFFGGGSFFEADDEIIHRTGVKPGTVFITNSRPGSSFMEKLPMFPGTNNTAVSIVKINGTEINCLDDMVKMIPVLLEKGHFNIHFKNYGVEFGFDNKLFFNQGLQTTQISVSIHDGPPILYKFNFEKHVWDLENISTNDTKKNEEINSSTGILKTLTNKN
jgi:S1-C subfamily serine protease